MTLYTQAESNIRKTWFYLGSFMAIIILLAWFFSYYFQEPSLLLIIVIFSFIFNFLSYWHSDKIVLSLTKAKSIEKKENPEIYRIVENLCITAGLPLPKIYIIDSLQPNAFVTGRDANHAALVLTKGILEKLEKNELEGVISHELSHIGNKDILLATIVVVLVGVITTISDWFLRASFWGHRDRDNSNGSSGAILAVLGILAAVLAPIAALFLQMAISRKREFLADASGALLTRYPEGLASALEKISNDSTVLKTASNSTAHLFIVSPLRGKRAVNFLAKLFSTHPPIEERIKALRDLKM